MFDRRMDGGMEGPGGGFIEGRRAGRMEGLAETREMEQVKWEARIECGRTIKGRMGCGGMDRGGKRIYGAAADRWTDG